jgi:hypothetical protein
MAKKKKENTLSYLQMPLPQGGRYSKMTKVAFGGLNKRYTHDSGDLSMEKNISTSEYPYLTPSKDWHYLPESYLHPISMSAFDDFVIIVYYDNNKILVDYIIRDRYIYTGILEADADKAKATKDTPRSIVQFNVYDTPTDPVTGQFIKKLLFFPDKASMFMRIEEIEEEFDIDTADTGVMYFHNGVYSTVKVIRNTDKDGKVTYTREQTMVGQDKFVCDGMDVDINEYRNEKEEIDESGAKIYPPPETASHNGYYRNSFNNDIYRWVEYPIARKEKDEDGKPKKDENGNYVFEKDDDGNYIYDGETTYGWKVSFPPTMPDLKYATVHLSRVFGVDDDRVYASGYNDYTNWNLDTIDEYNEANAWCSPSQANTKAGGTFTGITTFQNHVICFKRDFMHEIYNTKNPFRLQDIYAEGAIDNRTIQDVDGKLIFVSDDDVKIYTGSNPRIIGFNLNMPKYAYAVSGTDNRNYYLYCEENSGKTHLYVYDTYTELWSEQTVPDRVLSFAHNKSGMYMLCNNGSIYRMSSGYADDWSFETDLVTNKTVNIKHIKKLQMLVEVAKNANLRVYILYDDEIFDSMSPEEKAKKLVFDSNGKTGKFPIRVKPRNTANYGFKLHVEGKKYVKLYELEIFVEAGGDLYV